MVGSKSRVRRGSSRLAFGYCTSLAICLFIALTGFILPTSHVRVATSQTANVESNGDFAALEASAGRRTGGSFPIDSQQLVY